MLHSNRVRGIPRVAADVGWNARGLYMGKASKPFVYAGVLFLLLDPCPASAGGLSTSGQGSRALGMGGAFTAIADDASAIYYNPAGMMQNRGSEIMAGAGLGAPEVSYEMPGGAVQKSSKRWEAPWLFAAHRLSFRASVGGGAYCPFARCAKFEPDPANGFLEISMNNQER